MLTANNFKFLCICIIVSFLFTLGNTAFDFVNKNRIAKTEAQNTALQNRYDETVMKQQIANDELARINSELIANRQRLDSLHRYNVRLENKISATAATYAAIKKALQTTKTNFADSTKTAILKNLPE